MNHSRDRIRALWCRQLAGEQLNDAERQLLRHALRDRPDLCSELSDDATLHALLSSLEVVQTEDLFVQAVVQETMAFQEADSGAASSTPLPAVVGAASEGAFGQESDELPVLVNGQSSSDRRERSLQHSQQWLALLLTLVLFLSVGLMLWLQSERQSEIADTGPPPKELGADQEPEMPVSGEDPEPARGEMLAATDDANSGDVEASEDASNSPPQVAVNDSSTAPATTQDNSANSEQPNMAEETLPPLVSQPFATLTKLENPVWEREDTPGSRLGEEVVRLFGGTMEVTFDDGAVVTLEGPVEFQPRSASLLHLRRGRLSATVPKPAIGFTVLTPTSEVVDLGTEFDVSVKDSGASDVVVRKGEVEVAPGGRDGRNIQKWRLVPRGLNRASFDARPANGQRGPIAARAQGANGQFHGIISLDGRKAEFRSADTFNSVHERVMTRFATSQENTQRQWREFVDSMQRQMRGTMNFNGRQMQFGNLDEVMRLHNQIRNQPNTNAGASFTGSINVNGRIIRFETREEFEAARRAAFGPAANFGAGDILDMQHGPG
jgi:hypothetical protein